MFGAGVGGSYSVDDLVLVVVGLSPQPVGTPARTCVCICA